LWGQIKGGNKTLLDALAGLKEFDTLGCWCSPKPCHADVLIRAWEWMREHSPPV
jgi:hypothetical protein